MSVRTFSVIAAIGLLLLGSDFGHGAMWTYEWNAATQTPASVGLTFSNGTNPNTPTVEGLVIPDTGYYYGAFDGNSATGWTVAFRVRRVDTSSDFGSFLAIYDGSSVVRFDYYANTYYRMNSTSGTEYLTPPGGDNQDFADIQLTLSSGTVNVYYNGNDTPVFSYGALSDANPAQIYLGNYSSGTPVSEITYLRWSNEGAFVPSAIPEPSTVALLGGLGIAALLYRRRRAKS
ncbi:MAG TPA: PEP-CTERM sorting domain-containing protein [Terrimicrobiaceae bacterium]|nr:PEP-CTERM sorting domain-containing protein [Terrimicrobiaceae bacterium]